MSALIPPELQQSILQDIADEVDIATHGLQTLRACSLVCRAWHLWTLKHTFQELTIPATPRQMGTTDPRSYVSKQTPRMRLSKLLHLLESNHHIGEAVKVLEVYVYGIPDGAAPAREPPIHYIHPDQLNYLSRYIRPQTLSIRSASPNDVDFHPGFLDGLCNLIWTTTLRSLSFFFPKFPTILLAYAPNLKELSTGFSSLSDAIPQQALPPEGLDQPLPCLRTLRLHEPSPLKLQELQDAVQANSRLGHLFSRLEEVELDIDEVIGEFPRPWKSQLFSANLQHLSLFANIFVHDNFYDEFAYARMQKVPWDSLGNLESFALNLNLVESLVHANPYTEWTSGPLQHFFALASHLPFLRAIRIQYCLTTLELCNREVVETILKALYEPINEDIQQGFKSLKIFSTEIYLLLSRWTYGNLDSTEAKALIMSLLPALAGVRGRAEVGGCETEFEVHTIQGSEP